MALHKLGIAISSLVLLAVPAAGGDQYPDNSGSPGTTMPGGRFCATPAGVEPAPIPTFEGIQRLAATGAISLGSAIPVNFHVIHDGAEGNVPEEWLDAQIAVLNRTYSGRDYDGNPVPGAVNSGYSFYRNSVTRTNNRQWFKMSLGSPAENDAKNALVVDPEGSMNFYTCKPGQNALGWSTFPWQLIAHPDIDGVVVHYGTLPGGDEAPFNMGGTGTHEVGHWLGLLHTFQGGCYADESCSTAGDMVCDTPAEGSSTSGCPSTKDSCSGTGPDPIHNYMDYSTDVCYNNFTPGQDARMDFMMSYYRPGISLVDVAGVGDGAGFPQGAALSARPNPTGGSTTIRFVIDRDAVVSLQVFDLAGRLVTTLLDGRATAGAHAVAFDGGRLPSGVYFYVLNDGESVRRNRLLLVR